MKYTALCTIAAFAAVSHAGFFSESGDNNSPDEANDIGIFSAPGGSIAIDGTITDRDVDWFMFTLDQTASLSFFSAFGTDGADGIMQIATQNADLTYDVLAFDDDSGVGFMPAIQIENLAAGVYFIGLSGFGDVDSGSVDSDELANGEGHSENFSYKLNVGFSIIPAPSAMALLGMGGLVATRRRRS